MSKILRVFSALVFVVGALGCDGVSRVHELPPRHPATESDDTGDVAEQEVEPAPSYAEPPASSEYDFEAPQGSRPPPAAAPAAPRRYDGTGSGAAAKKSTGGPGWDGDEERARSADADSRWSQPREPRNERPGLATHWGETRFSPSREVSFERDDSNTPSALAELRYDSRAGARRLLPYGRAAQSELQLLGGALRVRMLDAAGRPFPALREGERVVGMGQPGERYSLSIENRSGERFEVVASVDGLDVLDGEGGSPDKRGYLVAAYSSVVIDGFRRSAEEVAAFRLGDVAHSYAASKGSARNVGVIGFAAFAERQAQVYYPRYPRRGLADDTYLRETSDPFPGRYAQPPVR
jgi:hypothetical protein